MSISVTQLVSYIKRHLEIDPNLQGLLVTGEISNYHCQINSGHLYFTLKDDKAQISCVMFKGNASSLNFNPKNGDKVEISGRVSVFETSGQMQVYVTSMRLNGIGDLFQQYEMLKQKLKSEGYFESNHKKPLKTKFLNKVAVLTGDKSAAMSDIKTCFLRRWPLCKVDYYPVLVQGNEAPNDIINKLKEVDLLNYEAIILARGGGSFEDLFCFNNEELVKTIYSLKTFIVTGVGHEQDFTLVDFVSDLRAPTPTASVELITINIVDIKMQLKELSEANCFKNPTSIFERKQMILDYYSSRLFNYEKRFKEIGNKLLILENIMNNAMRKRNNELAFYIQGMTSKLITNANKKTLIVKSEIENDNIKLKHLIEIKYNDYKRNVENLCLLLEAYSKDSVLKRGYTLVKQDGHYLKKLEDIKNKDMTIEFIDGSIDVSVR